MYEELKKLQKLLFKGDDRIDQVDLFDAQELIAEITLKAAEAEGKTKDLVKTFPYLYKLKSKCN
jgi:hypothetical protein